jgi:hypothetical protein
MKDLQSSCFQTFFTTKVMQNKILDAHHMGFSFLVGFKFSSFVPKKVLETCHAHECL